MKKKISSAMSLELRVATEFFRLFTRCFRKSRISWESISEKSRPYFGFPFSESRFKNSFRVAAELEGAQAGANTASQNAMSAQAQASQRALSAMSQEGSLGRLSFRPQRGYIAKALNAANATDAINQFNARNSNAVCRLRFASPFMLEGTIELSWF